MSHIQLYTTDREDEVVCPYDPSHVVTRKRLQYHLMKCRKNHQGQKFAVCPFNATHEMPKSELQYHKVHCPDKAMLITDMSYAASMEDNDGTYFSGNTELPVYRDFQPPSSENWDDEIVDNGVINSERQSFNHFNGGWDAKFNNDRRKASVRRPISTPQIHSGGLPDNHKMVQPPNVFSYSLSMAGVGRGAMPGADKNDRPLGLGRSRGRTPSQYLPVQKSSFAVKDVDSTIDFKNDDKSIRASEEDKEPMKASNIPPNKATSHINGGGRGQGSGKCWQELPVTVDMHQATVLAQNVSADSNGFVTKDVESELPVTVDMYQATVLAQNVSADSNGFVTKDVESDKENSGNVCGPIENAKKGNRRLYKKLRQIEELEKKKSSGKYLTEEQFKKISQKDNLLHELEISSQ